MPIRSDPAVPAAQTFDKATSSMIRQVQRLNAELEAGGARNAAYFEKMASVKGADMSALAPYLADLKKAEAAQRVATTGLDQMGMSAKQTTAALRQVPMQFTDIVVSLQGGQSAMQVFLQQGGQLKDMFGGAGNAARALGGYVLGLVNPFTIAAAAVAGIAVAYKQGSAEADGYRMALVMTGNAAGTTAAQMQQMAGRISSVVGTQGAAAEALAQMASSGRVASQSLEYFSEVAIKFERTTGTAISETVKRFAELGASPVDASRKLNEETNYLTASIYEQIKALKDQGREADAAALAQNTYADALNNRSAQITQNLGAIEGAWKAIKDAAKSGWDAMLNVGRADSLGTQIDNMRAKIAQAKGQDKNRPFSMPWDTSLADLEKQLSFLTEQERVIRRGAEAQAQRTQAEKDAIAATDALQKTQASGMTNQQKMNKALEEYARHIEKLKATNPASVLLSPDAIARGEKAIRDQFSDKGKGSAGIKAVNKDLADQQRIYAELAGVSSTYHKELAAAQEQRAKGNVSEAQYVAYVNDLIQKQPFAVALAKEEAKEQQTLAKANTDAAQAREKYLTSLSAGLDKIQADITAQIEATERMGLSKEAIADLDAAKLEMMATDLELQAIKAMDRNLDEQTYDALKQQAQAYRDLAKAKQAGAAKEVAVDAAKKAADEWQRTSDQVNQSLTDALMRGFESGKDFAQNLRDTVVNMFKTLVLRPVISAVVNPVAGALTGALGFAGTASAATGAASGGSGIGSIVSAGSSIYSALTTGVSNSITSAFSKFATSSVGTSLGLSTPAVVGNNPSAYVAPQLSSAGSAIGTGLGMLGSGLAGYGISSAISNGYTTGGNTVNVLSGIASAFFGPLAGAAGGLINRAFGRKLKDVGIEGTLGGAEGFEGQQYQFYKGGWFRSDKTKYQDLDPTTASGLAQSFKAIQGQVGAFATVLGLETDRIASFTTQLKISTKGLDDAGIAQAFQEALATGSNELAQQVLGTTTSEFARDGEKAIDTLTRLATSVTTVNTIWENLGFTLYEASLAGADAASTMADAFGGLENLAAVTGVYYENFYSEAEKAANVTRDVTAALADVGLQMPTTREGFRALVEQQAALGESGAQAVATLLSVSGAFASVTAASETAAEAAARLADEQAKAAKEAQDAYQKQARAAQEAADAARRAQEDLLEALTKAAEQALKILGNAIDAEKKVQQAEYDAQMVIIDAQRKASTTFVEAQRAWLGVAIGGAQNYAKVMESEAARIRGFFTGMVLQDDPDAPAGASVFSAQAALRAGDTSDAVLRKATDIDPEMFSSWADYAINFFDTKSLVDQYATQAERAASVAASDVALLEQQLAKAEEQYQADLDHYTRLEGIAKDTLEANILRLDGILQAAQDQLAEALGTKLAVMGLGAALGNFAGAVGRLSLVTDNPITTPLDTSTPTLTSFGNTQAVDTYVQQITAYNPVSMGGTAAAGGNNDKVVAALQAVLSELQALRATGADTKAAVEKTSAILDQVTAGGNAMLTETA